MTVALLLAAAPDRLSAMAHPYRHPGDRLSSGVPWLDYVGDRLMSAGVRQVDVAMCADAADGLRAVAVAVRDTGEPVLVCTSARALTTPGEDLEALVGGTTTAALPAEGALLVASQDLPAVAEAAEALAARIAAGDHPGRKRRAALSRISRRTRVRGDLDSAVGTLIDFLGGSGIRVASPNGSNGARAAAPAPGQSSTPSFTAPPESPSSAAAARPARPPAGSAAHPAPPEPGLVTGLVTGPPAGWLARQAAARGLPSAIFTTAALALSVCAAAWFAAGTRSSLVTGSLLLCAALPFRQAGNWPLRRGPADQATGGWLAAVAGPAGEYAVYAGLAIGWAGGGNRQAWEYATAAMIVLAVRQTTDACYAALRGSRAGHPGGSGRDGVRARDPGRSGHRLLRLAGQSITLPAGERTLLIAVAVAVWGPRTALAALIGWGAVALGYVLAEHAVTSRDPGPASHHGHSAGHSGLISHPSAAASHAGPGPVSHAGDPISHSGGPASHPGGPISHSGEAFSHPGGPADHSGSPSSHPGGPADRAEARATAAVAAAARDDGPLASWLGHLVRGQLPPLLPAVAGVTVTAMLAALGLRNLPGVLLLAPPVAMLLAALGADNPHVGLFDWLVPPLLQAGEYVYLAAVTFPAGVPAPAAFALIAAIALHRTDLLQRQRRGIPPSSRMAASLGWEGRMLVAGFGGMLGIEAFVGTALAVYLWAVFGWDSLTSWSVAWGASR